MIDAAPFLFCPCKTEMEHDASVSHLYFRLRQKKKCKGACLQWITCLLREALRTSGYVLVHDFETRMIALHHTPPNSTAKPLEPHDSLVRVVPEPGQPAGHCPPRPTYVVCAAVQRYVVHWKSSPPPLALKMRCDLSILVGLPILDEASNGVTMLFQRHAISKH